MLHKLALTIICLSGALLLHAQIPVLPTQSKPTVATANATLAQPDLVMEEAARVFIFLRKLKFMQMSTS